MISKRRRAERRLPWIASIDAFQHWVYGNPQHTRSERQAAWLQIRARFADLHKEGTFLLPNVWDTGSARILEAAGFPAIATTSAAAGAGARILGRDSVLQVLGVEQEAARRNRDKTESKR